jgi:hypothetical protein
MITAFAKNGYSKEESFLGSLTYSIYLIHLPVLIVVSRIAHLEGMLRLIPFGITLVLSLIVARFVEEDIVERSRKKWLNSWKPDGEGAMMRSGRYYAIILALLVLSMGFYSNYYLKIIHLKNCSEPQGWGHDNDSGLCRQSSASFSDHSLGRLGRNVLIAGKKKIRMPDDYCRPH